MDFQQGKGTVPIGEEADPIPNSIPQHIIRLSILLDSVELYLISFYTEFAKKMWEFISKRKVWSERSMRISNFQDRGLDFVLLDRQLIGTVKNTKPYMTKVVKEFYCNLHDDIIKPDSTKFGQIFIRGKIYLFSAKMVNDYLESLNAWPRNSTSFPTAQLTLKYAIFYKKVVTNWTLTSNDTVTVRDQAMLLYCIGIGHFFNLSRHIMRTITKHAEVKTTVGHFSFPFLIYNMLVSQSLKKLRTKQLEFPNVYYFVSTKFGKFRGPVSLSIGTRSGTTATPSSSEDLMGYLDR
ncbi:hypothetical protein Pfo_011558 [Paulownia fortunei]|nr:hypothetical protein Pfo_011558 [Paulownia fortunei]